jgi:hypothetical protein
MRCCISREGSNRVSKAFGIGFGVAALVIAIVLWVGFSNTKGNHLDPTGFISDVRVQGLTPEETLMVIDFGLFNDADVQMICAKIDPWITTRGGQDIHGTLFAGADMAKTFAYYPQLGPMLHPPLPLRGTIDGHKKVNLMVGVEFDVPAEVVESRKGVTLHIEDITGPFVELTAK